ncbi:MAG: CRISPR-associated helicase Cas3' [Verrucomicrobiia bacterium]
MTLLAHPNQPLAEHLKRVSEKAASFAEHFGGSEHARLAGLLHDLGKAEIEFQKRITTGKGKEEPHCHHGAALVLGDENRGAPIWPVAFAINGHHAGLHNRGDVDKRRSEFRKAQAAVEWLKKDSNGQEWLPESFGDQLPSWLKDLPYDARFTSEGWLATELFIRFLFSALIDGDRLDTEENSEVTKGLAPGVRRRGWNPFDANVLLQKLETHLLEIEAQNRDKTSTDVARVRNEVAAQCRTAALGESGIYSLTVPTGGGKTLASMLFALEHAKRHPQIRRIIVVIPYLSIIQQTVKVYQDAFGDGWVLEHHSQAQDPEIPKKAEKKDGDDYSLARTLRQLAAENWDAPVIVTTSVQFFDSLFSRRPADARKLHNIAQSVIIFDECQTFPPRLMQPILNVLGELANTKRPYGCSLVFCTATQPALEKSDDLLCGLPPPSEINQCKTDHFVALRRTVYPELESLADIPIQSWNDIASDLLKSPDRQGLVVVNTRQHARELFATVQQAADDKTVVFHLSTWMTPAHRLKVLDEVRRRLSAKQPCFLISTQCIEAGVDVDFPAAWRAFGPYDAIVQAAGRCNRNGNLKDAQVHVFRPEKESLPPGVYDTATKQTDLLRKLKQANPHNPDSFATYFRLLYQLSVPDECEIQQKRGQLHFEEVSELFRFIDSFTVTVLIIEELVEGKPQQTPALAIYEQARPRGFFTAEDWRQLQPYILNLDFRSKNVQASLAKYADHAFDSEDCELRIWRAGTAGYIGGLNGTGIELKDPDFGPLLQGGL